MMVTDNLELISIVIPVYNIERYLPRCLETIASQTYHNLEIILVDDGSTDNSGNICDTFAKKDSRAMVIHQENLGLWAARNSGQRVAKGNYLMFVDSDDYLHLDAIKIMIETFHQYPQSDLVFVDYIKTCSLEENIETKKSYNTSVLSQEELIHQLFNYYGQPGLGPFAWNKLYKRELLEGIWTNDYPRAQDLDFNIRVLFRVSCATWIHCELYFWVQRPTSFVHQSNYWDIAHPCMVKMFFLNYINLPVDKKQYGHYLLDKLYKRMLFYKNRNYKKVHQASVFKQCREYEKATWKAYWLNGRIPLYEKVGVTFLLHNPRLTCWLMKVTNNY